MSGRKEYIKKLVASRKKFISKLEELLGDNESIKLHYNRLDNIVIDIIAKNQSILVIANESFKNYFEKVDYDAAYNSKK